MRISDWSSDVCSSDLDHAGHFHQGPQGDQQRRRLRRGEAQRAIDPGRERDLDTFLGEGQVDEITGTITGKSAHPQWIAVGQDRKSVVQGTSVVELGELGYRWHVKKKKSYKKIT